MLKHGLDQIQQVSLWFVPVVCKCLGFAVSSWFLSIMLFADYARALKL